MKTCIANYQYLNANVQIDREDNPFTFRHNYFVTITQGKVTTIVRRNSREDAEKAAVYYAKRRP